jgi:DNA-binding FrmR family transcriptional regulator
MKHRHLADGCHSPEAPPPSPMPSHAKSVDKRLARIEGQIRGLRRMVDEGRYCIDILVQIQAVQESLKSTSSLLLENHLRSCVNEAFSHGTTERKEVVLKELSGLLSGK